MAFSTQKEFFHVPFMNQALEFDCKRLCVKLKSYDSTVDDRSWAMDEFKQSKFLADLVACNTPAAGYDAGIGVISGPRTRGLGGDRGGDIDRSQDHDSDDNDGHDRPGTSRRSSKRRGGGDRSPSRGGTGNRGGDRGAHGLLGGGGTTKGGLRTGPYGGAGAISRGEVINDPDNSKADISQICDDIYPEETRGGREAREAHEGLPAARSNKYDMKTGDSVLECANQTLCKLDEVLNDKKNLQKQLEVSNECLKSTKEENEKIKDILNKKFDRNLNKDFHNKIHKLSASGKLSKEDENDLLQLYYKFEDMNKAYEISEAESSYLKRLTEKLCQRAMLDSINLDPERETDVSYLQNEVNNLRKEVLLLRKYEDESLRQKNNQPTREVSVQDAGRIRQIIEERNALREKCKAFKNLEKQIKDLQKKAHEADNMSDNLSANLNSHSKYICDMECEMQRMQKYYEAEMEKLKYADELSKLQVKELKEDLCRAQCKAQKTDCLQMEIGCLRNELLKRDLALGDYDCQYKQLMYKAKTFKNCGYRLLQQTPETDHDNSLSS